MVMVKIINFIENKYSQEDLSLIDKLNIEQFAKAIGYYKRGPKKITATNLFKSFLLMKKSGRNSLRVWATELGKLINDTVSKEALNARLNEQGVELFSLILKHCFELKLNKTKIKISKENNADVIQHFNRILIRDSTVQQVNSALSEHFPGSHSSGNPTALIRIQALYDFTSEKWVDFGFTTYGKNDQGAAFDIANSMEKRDLLLQDLGYFVLEWLEQILKHQYVITKWDNKTNLYEVNGEKIDLLKLLKGKKRVDMNVLVGSKKKLPMRLVIKKIEASNSKKKNRGGSQRPTFKD